MSKKKTTPFERAMKIAVTPTTDQPFVLTKKNLAQWKKRLDKKMDTQYPNVSDKGWFSKSKTDKEWIEDHLGSTDQIAIDEEVQYWEE